MEGTIHELFHLKIDHIQTDETLHIFRGSKSNINRFEEKQVDNGWIPDQSEIVNYLSWNKDTGYFGLD